jgi:GH15 family glucan-1,4-alpha-glucosidase
MKGKEGTFVLCTFWLDQALALADRPHRAGAVFERAVAYVHDLGGLAADVDDDREMLGNFPQTFSHISLVNTAWAISDPERCQATSAG